MLTAWTNQIENAISQMAKLKGQQPATNSWPGNTTLHYYKLLPKHYPALLHITTYNITSYCFYITSIFENHITSYYSKINHPLLHITTWFLTLYYFKITSILLQYYFLLIQNQDNHYYILLHEILLRITSKLLPYYFIITSN